MARPRAATPAAAEAVSAPDTAPTTPLVDMNTRVAPIDIKAEFDPYFDEVDTTSDRGDMIEPEQPPEPAPVTDEAPPEPVSAPPTVDPDPEPATPKIPKARFDEVNEERKRLRAENERLQAELAARLQQPEAPAAPPAPEYDFQTKEKEYMEAVLDGDTDKALALRSEIRQAEFQAIQAQVQKSVPRPDEAADVVQTRMANQAALDEVNTAFPIFDPNSETFDSDLTEEAVAIARGFIEFKGMPYPDAIRKAADQVARLNGVARIGSTPATPARQVVDPKAVQRKLEQAASQPPTTPVTPVPDEDGVDPLNMTDEEFMKLPARTIARLRGDIL